MIVPICFDSFGVRSQATLIRTNINILIDPSAALAPRRYGLKPSEIERKALEFYLTKIFEFIKLADLIFITHYHWDHVLHYKRNYEIFKGKTIILKDYKKMHKSAKKRGKIVEEKLKDLAKIEFVDNGIKEFDNCYIEIREFWHGEENSKLGKVNTIFIEYKNYSILYFSDNFLLDSLNYAIEKSPKFAILDGFPTIFLNKKYSLETFLKFKENVKKFIEKTNVKQIILDHHIVRDLNYKEKIEDLIEFSNSLGTKICTAAEFIGLKNLFLEALRKYIYKGWEIDLKKYFESYEKIL